jgi:hypothetical protein
MNCHLFHTPPDSDSSRRRLVAHPQVLVMGSTLIGLSDEPGSGKGGISDFGVFGLRSFLLRRGPSRVAGASPPCRPHKVC